VNFSSTRIEPREGEGGSKPPSSIIQVDVEGCDLRLNAGLVWNCSKLRVS